MKGKQQAIAKWERINPDEVKTRFNEEIAEDVDAILKCCRLLGKEWNLDVLDASKSYSLLAVVTTDYAWIYEISKENTYYYHMTYLTRDDCYHLIRNMNERKGFGA